jgi:chemotaxis signal transduction protein
VRRQLVSFRLHRQLVGLDILYVREINTQLDVTRVQLAERDIVGVSNLRGQIVTIFDLVRRLGLTPSERATEHHDVVLRSDAELAPIRVREGRHDLTGTEDVVGLRVDGVGEIIDVDESDFRGVPANLTHINHELLSSAVPLERELLIVLDVKRLFAPHSATDPRPR